MLFPKVLVCPKAGAVVACPNIGLAALLNRPVVWIVVGVVKGKAVAWLVPKLVVGCAVLPKREPAVF